MEADVPLTDVITTDPETATALDHDARAKLVDMLADEAMAVDAIREELARRGEELAETTVRHHVNVLRDAGLVEVARLEEAGGGTRKYYRSTARVFSYELPDGADETLAAAAGDVRDDLAALLAGVGEDHGDAVAAVVEQLQPCEYCERQHYEEFVVRELLSRALSDLAEDGELSALLDAG